MERHEDLPVVFNKPCFAGNEQRYIAEAIANLHISGDGPFTKACHAYLESALNIRRALLTTSCTHALEMTAMLLALEPGDEVIMPSFTFVSTANAFVLRGARPVFIDIRPDTLNIDEHLIERAITKRTKAIVLVHYAGVACEMDTIMEIAGRHRVPLIEDNAHGLFATYKHKYLGSFGTLATQSFHETKNFTCGEGGALLINDERFIEQAEMIREKGTDRARFYRGLVDKYTWVTAGSSYLPSDVLSAFLLAQLEAREHIQNTRRRLWNRYFECLKPLAAREIIGIPHVPPACEQAYHMFYILLRTLDERQELMSFLKQRSISAVFHYVPLHRSPMAKSIGSDGDACPTTDNVSERILRLPFHNQLTVDEQERVIEAVHEFCTERVH